MAAYTYEKELGILGFLEQACEGKNVKFFWTNTRANSTIINKRLGIKYVQGRYVKGQDVIEVYLMKNFAKESSDWRKMFSKMYAHISALVNQGKVASGMRYYADTGESLPIAKPRKSAFEQELDDLAAQKAQADVASTLSPDIQKLLTDLKATLPKGSDSDLMDALKAEDRGAQVANFTLALGDGKHILLPNQAWRSTGFARQAAQDGVRVLRLDPDSPLLALPLTQFQSLATKLGYTVTDEPVKIVPKFTNIQPNPTTSAGQFAKAYRENILQRPLSAEEEELKLLDNPEATLKDLEKVAAKGIKLSDDRQKLLNVLRKVVNNNEVSLLTMKKLRLQKVIAKQAREYEQKRDAQVDALKRRNNPEDNSQPASVRNQRNLMSELTQAAIDQVIQIKKVGTYWTAVSINGVAIIYT